MLQVMPEVLLEVVEGPASGRQVPLNGPVEIGRDPRAGVVLQDDQTSRHHVRITPIEGGALAEDLGSTNGTFVNGNQIHAPTRMTPGDQLLVGISVIQLRSATQVARQPSAVRPVPPALASPPRQPDFIPGAVAKGGGPPTPELDRLLDIRTKAKARTAPLAIFILVVFVVLIYLATRA